MALNLRQKYDVLKHLKNKGSLLVHKIVLNTHPLLNVNIGELVSYLDSLISRGYLEEHYVWRHGYYLVTADGRKKIEDELEIPGEIKEATAVENEDGKAGFEE